MNFQYQARDLTGHVRDGQIVADTIEEARLQLRRDGLYVISLAEGVAAKAAAPLIRKRVKRSDIIYMTNQMAVMVDAGVPVADVIEGLAEQCDHPTLKDVLTNIHKNVEGGETLSTALSRYPKLFDRTYVNLVKASEASGSLGPMLDRISTQMRNELESRQKVKGAMIYPLAMLLMCIGVSVFLLTYVFPKLMPMFESRGVDLPKPTRLMIFLSTSLSNYWYFWIAGLALAAGFLWYARKQPWGRAAFDWMWLNAPIVGPLCRKVAISRSLRTLATTINAGVPMLDSLELCAAVSSNVYYERCWRHVTDQVTAGKQIHEALRDSSLFPPTLLQMVSSGESTGKLGHVLNKVSDYFDREVEVAVKSATSMLEPLMVAVMGSVIGTIALAMLLPVFSLSTQGVH